MSLFLFASHIDSGVIRIYLASDAISCGKKFWICVQRLIIFSQADVGIAVLLSFLD